MENAVWAAGMCLFNNGVYSSPLSIDIYDVGLTMRKNGKYLCVKYLRTRLLRRIDREPTHRHFSALPWQQQVNSDHIVVCFDARNAEALELLTQRLLSEFELDKPASSRWRFLLFGFHFDEAELCALLPSCLPAFNGTPQLTRLIANYLGLPSAQPVTGDQLLQTQKLLRCPAPIRVDLYSLASVQEMRNAIGDLVQTNTNRACCIQ